MDEQLTCTVCSKNWTRKRSRGRKPLVCPDCISSGTTFIPPSVSASAPISSSTTSSSSGPALQDVYKALYPKPPYANELMESTKKGSIWKCPSCGNILKILVPITEYPYHNCNPNTKKSVKYERLS